MNRSIAARLSTLTSSFYAQVNESFSETRNSAWEGWEQFLPYVQPEGSHVLRLADFACGNLRFERFLKERNVAFEAWCADACAALVERGSHYFDPKDIHVAELDLAEVLLEDDAASVQGLPTYCDLAVSFGFMHHLPLLEQRARLLDVCLQSVRKHGYVVISFWQFAHSERLHEKALKSTAQACEELGIEGIGEGDYLLGWQNSKGIYRYCHHFEDDEIDALVANLPAKEIARFSADGKTHDLNRYVVLEKTS